MAIFKAWSGWREYGKLAADWRNIVFYSESGQDWHFFEGLIDVLNGDVSKKVTYVTSDPSDPGLQRKHDLFKAICIPAGFFLTLHFNMQKADVVVLTMMDLGNLQLKKSINPIHYVYVFHSLGSTHMVDHANSYDAYDSLFCAGPHHIAELRKREELAGLPERNLFEYGHPRLEELLALADSGRCEDTRGGPQTILIAPTWGVDSIFNRCGEILTALLLDAGYRVIIRPHYQTLALTPAVIDSLKDKFAEHPNFEYQDRMSESESLLRSDLLICDWSAMAIEYVFGLEKPVLFIDLPRRIRNPDWKTLAIEPLEVSFREVAGDVVSPANLQEVPEKVARLLEGGGEFGKSMQALRSEMVFNLGHSTEPGAGEIARLAEEMSRQRLLREQRDV